MLFLIIFVARLSMRKILFNCKHAFQHDAMKVKAECSVFFDQ